MLKLHVEPFFTGQETFCKAQFHFPGIKPTKSAKDGRRVDRSIGLLHLIGDTQTLLPASEGASRKGWTLSPEQED